MRWFLHGSFPQKLGVFDDAASTLKPLVGEPKTSRLIVTKFHSIPVGRITGHIQLSPISIIAVYMWWEFVAHYTVLIMI